MRKKIFIIHGKGVNRGIGKEGGGDLDTVAANAFYLVWAKNALREELGREPEYGRDYECDFVNYSEGVGHLAARPGCDVYLPDFPIDALPPRLRMSVIEDEETADLLNRFAAEVDDFRLWIVRRADQVSDEVKAVFNTAFKQAGKILGHQEKAALLAARSVLALARQLSEIDAWCAEQGVPRYPDYLAGFMGGMLSHLIGPKVQDLKKTLLVQMDDNNKERMIDLLEDENAIFAFDEAARLDLSSRGRINYTDELIILLTEAAAYAVRGMVQLRDLPWKEKPRRDFCLTLKAVLDDLRRVTRTLISLGGAVALPEDPRLKELTAGADQEARALLDLFSRIETTVPVPVAAGAERLLMVMVSEEATGKPAEGVEVVFRRLSGSGELVLPDGALSRKETVAVATDARGLAFFRYRPSGPDEEFQFSASFDGLQELRLPVPPAAFDEEVEAVFAEVVEEVAEEEFEEKEAAKEAEPDRALRVSLAMMERHFRLLQASDVKVVSIDDHHPFTPEVLASLQKLQAEGIIGRIQIASLPRGEELPIEKQKCGSDLIYADRIRGKPWDNPGLAELVRLAHQHDLHIKIEPASLEISKLIGSRYNKIEIARQLSERVQDLESMRTIMESTGWDAAVKKYEESLEKVFPRIEGIVGKVLLRAPGKPEETARILAALSPFCDAKKGEAQINVASALHYLLGRKKLETDYFFYCYGSQLMTTRRPNEQATMNLSTLCQHIGSRADGGHSGAATCRPSSNSSFPVRRLSRVGDTNFLEFIGYLGKKTGEFAGMEVAEVSGVAFEPGPAPIEKALLHLREHAFEIAARATGEKGDGLHLIFVRAPPVNRRAGEEKPSFLQALGYLKRHLVFDYLIFVQGGLYRVILCRSGTGEALLDLPRLARAIGWRGDGGDQVLATADIKKNKAVKKRLRRMYHPHLVQLASLVSRSVAGLGGWETAVRPVLFGGVEEDFKKVCGRMDASAWIIELAGEGRKGLTLVAALSPAVDPAASEMEPSLPLVADHFKNLQPNYLIYSESEIRFPKEQAISALMRVDDPGRGIDCSRAVSVLAGNQFCGDDAVAEYMPAFLEDSPLGIRILSPENHRDFLEYSVPRMAQSAGYSVVSIRPVVSQR
jgi:hypothetical protein